MQHKAIKYSLVLLLVITGLSLVSAQKKLNLTAVSGYPPTNTFVSAFEDVFITEVDAELAAAGNYEINWNKAFSGTVASGREMLDAMEAGLGDVGLVHQAFESARLLEFLVSYVTPFTTTNLGVAVKAQDDIIANTPEMAEVFDSFDQVHLASWGSIDTYQIMSAKPIESLADFKGLKVGGAGLNLAWVEGLGAVGVPMGSPAMYNNVQTGVVDAVIIWGEAAVINKLYEVAPYFVKADLGAAVNGSLTFNKLIWDTMPEEVQTVMQAAAYSFRDELANTMNEESSSHIETYVENGGTLIEITDEQKAEWAATVKPLALDWAAELDSKGQPGTAILEAYMNAMRDAGEPVARNWDQE